jgi:hypothetical protein
MFRVQSSLVLVDVITKDRNSGLPIQDFQKKDFRLFDNRREVPITTFDAGARYDTRPVTLWLVVICNESGLPKLGASAEFLGQESLFRPHSTIWKPMTASELPIGATTATPKWIYCLQKTAIKLSRNWLKRSSPFLSKEVRAGIGSRSVGFTLANGDTTHRTRQARGGAPTRTAPLRTASRTSSSHTPPAPSSGTYPAALTQNAYSGCTPTLCRVR